MESLRCLAHGLVEKVTMVFDLTGESLHRYGQHKTLPDRQLVPDPHPSGHCRLRTIEYGLAGG